MKEQTKQVRHLDQVLEIAPFFSTYAPEKVFSIKNAVGKKRDTLLSKVVKSCPLRKSSNKNVERSLSDNQNTLIPDRNNLSDET